MIENLEQAMRVIDDIADELCGIGYKELTAAETNIFHILIKHTILDTDNDEVCFHPEYKR